jgi:hypothetical protein
MFYFLLFVTHFFIDLKNPEGQILLTQLPFENGKVGIKFYKKKNESENYSTNCKRLQSINASTILCSHDYPQPSQKPRSEMIKSFDLCKESLKYDGDKRNGVLRKW